LPAADLPRQNVLLGSNRLENANNNIRPSPFYGTAEHFMSNTERFEEQVKARIHALRVEHSNYSQSRLLADAKMMYNVEGVLAVYDWMAMKLAGLSCATTEMENILTGTNNEKFLKEVIAMYRANK
jgi:hypothetical protein